ncbi:MAG: crotonase/enoyl-CoA hydratase family protein [Betaproteobacteria bacterium]|nr:crotonase/enoyl-CoA hydratase family protein [Betaproteobacteria bacterium]MDH5287911.1 crotonase/enoyl-CoA hydratase family protein [Betaproteobacteria bacterium]
MNAVANLPVLSTSSSYSMLDFEYLPEHRTLFSWMKPTPRACFSAALLEQIRESETLLQSHRGFVNHEGQPGEVAHVVFGSRVSGVFNLGGDLNMFIQAILRQDRQLLSYYAHLCVDNQMRRHRGFECGIATVALVQGKALGGGFECALACHTIVAERSATMALPETLFNLFPGMGALSFLGRRIGLRKAEQLIVSGATFTASDLHDMGVVDEVVEDGMGVESVKTLLQQRHKRHNTFRSLAEAKLAYHTVTREELERIVDVWVDGALRLESRDLKMMTRLVRAQDKLTKMSPEDQAIEQMYSPPPEKLHAA